MNYIYKKFKSAFSLLELTICILIVSIIVVVCVPLIMDQMKKTEEYSYFLGFKTVEKLASQIVAFGDPDDSSVALYKQDMDFRSGFSKVVANNFNKFTKNITPKAFAANQLPRTILLSFPSYEYDLARLCNGNTSIFKNYEDEAGNSFTPEEIAAMGCLDSYTNNDSLKLRFACDNSTYANTVYLRTDESESAEDFCKKVAAQCISKYSSYSPKYDYERITLNQAGNRSEYYQCIVYIEQAAVPVTGSSGTQSAGVYPNYTTSTCNGFGYYNTDSTGTLKTLCSCGAGTLPAINNPSVCCNASTITAGNVPYANKNGTCVSTGCKIGAFNEKSGTCCPANSFYSRTLGHCSCAQGYEPNNADNLTACVKIEPIVCPTGYHLDADSDVCVVNAPITKAKRFCELIIDNYNVSYSKCDDASFNGTKNYGGNSDPVSYNKTLYDAITAGGTSYLSARAVEGAFNSVLPNIVFSNGLKLWILGDKVASIAGLSFNPSGYSPEINSCVDMKVYTKAACDAIGGTHYFCPGGNRCFTIPNGDGTVKLTDARNCCPTVTFDDFKSAYAGNGYLRDPRAYAINGFTVFVDITGEKDSDQGGGTLWKDVFPFYIAANGTVYPAYPLDASKSDISLYQGGNSSALNSDVYYFDVVTREDGSKLRKKQMAYTSIPYSRAQCFALQVSAFTPYCQNLGSKFRLSRKGQTYEKMDQYIYSDENPCWKHRCYVHVKNKIKFL